MTPEDARQTRYTLAWCIVIIAGLALLVTFVRDQYAHPMPASDCSEPYEYPICRRAVDPVALAPPTATAVFLALLATGILMLALVVIGYRASVIRQAALVVSAPSVTPVPAQPAPATRAPVATEAARIIPVASAPLAASPATPVQSQAPKTAPPQRALRTIPVHDAQLPAIEGADTWGHPIPRTIRNNMITKEMVAAPAVKPVKGIDPKLLEGNDG